MTDDGDEDRQDESGGPLEAHRRSSARTSRVAARARTSVRAVKPTSSTGNSREGVWGTCVLVQRSTRDTVIRAVLTPS